jgi:hypothetical protein
MDNRLLVPPTITFGSKTPNLRFRSKGGRLRVFCLNNENLHLTEEVLEPDGTYEAGLLLSHYCRKLCVPSRKTRDAPCPAFVKSCTVGTGTQNKGLATVEMRPTPAWEQCAGIKFLADLTDTAHERFFFLAYLEDKWSDEYQWRDSLVNDWNSEWHNVENGWAENSRRGKFEKMLWWTIRYPALIPQVWLNWLHAAPEEELRALDENPSRVDFVAFWGGQRHVVEIDGPSHYATYDEVARSYAPDEKAYARNLKIERTLRRDDWHVTRIGRFEVQEAMDDDNRAWYGCVKLLESLPFYANEGYAPTFSARDLPLLGLPKAALIDEDIPF